MKKKHKLVRRFEKWEMINKFQIPSSKLKTDTITNILLENRGMVSGKQKEEFITPTPPEKIKLKDLGISEKLLGRGIERIIKAIKKKEKIIIFGDYDVDGITSSAILWEYLYGKGADVTPYIPERFSEGYGIKIDSIIKLKKEYPKLSLIITVDNGINAFDAVDKAREMGIDTVIVDHHEKADKYPNACAVVYTSKLCGAGVTWFLVREIGKKLQITNHESQINNLLELAALGTVADQMPLTGANRSLAKYGLEKLNTTDRIGLNALYEIAGIRKGNIGNYEINYVLSPRLNAMGRLEHAIQSLRLLCTKNKIKALELAELLNKTNLRRQKIVDEVLQKTKNVLAKESFENIIILDDDSYHEGVIGLAASKLVEEFGRPAIVISRGSEISKGSARSIPGFNINEAVKYASDIVLSGGGHEMAAGFSLKTKNVALFKKMLKRYAFEKMKKDLFVKKIKIDLPLSFTNLSINLVESIKKMEPFGIGNPTPTFITDNCEIIDVRKVGESGNHLKFKLGNSGLILDAISFNNINSVTNFIPRGKFDAVYSLEENYWNGSVSMQLKLRDLK
jgi:single-stranded-DNA-specific exonuclease